MIQLSRLRQLTPIIHKFHKFHNIRHLMPPTITSLHLTTPKYNKIYTDNYDWLVDCGDYYKMGLSAKAIEELSEIVYVKFEPEDTYTEDEVMVVIESVNAVADIKTPYDCQIIEKNSALEEDFSTLNSDPECEEHSWILKIKKI